MRAHVRGARAHVRVRLALVRVVCTCVRACLCMCTCTCMYVYVYLCASARACDLHVCVGMCCVCERECVGVYFFLWMFPSIRSGVINLKNKFATNSALDRSWLRQPARVNVCSLWKV